MSVESGSVREIWLAPPDDHVGNKHSFLIRDDAYVMQEASFGRSVRLGQPIDLGPNGSWNQDGWFGGFDQERWFDEFMYQEGQVDTTDRVGRVRMWPGFEQLFGRRDGRSATTTFRHMVPAAGGGGENTPLVVCEHGPGAASWRIIIARPGDDNLTTFTHDAYFQAISPIANEGSPGGTTSSSYLVGDNVGRVYKLHTDATTPTFSIDTGSPSGDGTVIGTGAMADFNNAVFYGRGQALRRRSFQDGGSPTHTTVKHISSIDQLRAFVVWQNRLWFLGWKSNHQTVLYTSDGVTVVPVIAFPHGFSGITMVAHYGSLYIGGQVNSAPGGLSTSGQLWRYNGSSLTRLWNGGSVNQDGYGIKSLASHDRFVVWGRNGSDALGRRAGLWYYDAEEDAILEGPTLDMDPSATNYQVTGVASWNNTVVAAFKDQRIITPSTVEYPALVAFVRMDEGRRFKVNTADPNDDFGANTSFHYEPATITRKLVSSGYDADLPAVDKVWLTGFMRFKLAANAQLRVAVSVDEGAEQNVATFTHDGNDNWRSESFSVEDVNGKNLKGTEVRYTLYLDNTESANEDSTATPEVDFFGLQFQTAPDRQRIWYVRVLAHDAQERLDGTANPLTTRQALVDKLLEFWQNGESLSYWQAGADGAEPLDGTEVRVTMSNFAEQSYRISSNAAESASEVSFSLLEAAPSS